MPARQHAGVGLVGLIGAAVLSFVLSAQAQNDSPSECKTPLPKDVTIDAPAAGLSPERARLLGIWNGVWQSNVCAVLAIQSIDQAGKVKLIYAYPDFRLSVGSTSVAVAANAEETVGQIESGAINFTTRRGNRMSFTIQDDKLLSAITLRTGDTWRGTFAKP
jgi:hypothetical protein